MLLEQICRSFIATLHLVATKHRHRLRRQTQMGADRDAALDQEAHGSCSPAATFKLDHMRARLHQTQGASKGLLRALVVAAKGQIGDQPGTLATTCDTSGVIDHLVEQHGHGAGLALQHHAERVTHQQRLDAGLFQHRGESGVIAGQHGDLVAAGMHVQQALQAHWFAFSHRKTSSAAAQQKW